MQLNLFFPEKRHLFCRLTKPVRSGQGCHFFRENDPKACRAGDKCSFRHVATKKKVNRGKARRPRGKRATRKKKPSQKAPQSDCSKMLNFLQTRISDGSLVAGFDSSGAVEIRTKTAVETQSKTNKKSKRAKK
jgi:hypothetical protein